MGSLATLGSMAQSAAGVAGLASMAFGAAGTGAQAAGQLASAQGLADQYRYQAQIATNNAVISRANASNALEIGSYEESLTKLKYGEIAGAQKAAQAANGIDVGVGSAVSTRESTATIGAMDAAMVHYNAAKEAYGNMVQGANLDTQSALDKLAASNALRTGQMQAASTILGGSASLAGKWAQYGLSFGGGGNAGAALGVKLGNGAAGGFGG